MITSPPIILSTSAAHHSSASGSKPTPADPDQLLPGPILEVARAVGEAFGVETAPVAVALLAVLASALGTRPRCLVAGRAIPLGFNVLVITPSPAPARQGWLDFLQGPLRSGRDSREQDRAKTGTGLLVSRCKELDRDLSNSRLTGRPESELSILKMQRGDLAFGIASRFVESTLSRARLKWAIPHCADGGVLVVESRAGMAADLEGETVQSRDTLARWLRESWEGDVLLLDQKNGVAGRVTLVRSIPEEDLHRSPLLEFVGGRDPLPILLVPQGGPGRQVPRGGMETASQALARLMSRVFVERLRGGWSQLGLPHGAYEGLERFRDNIAIHQGEPLRGPLARGANWLPELSIRLAVLFALFRDGADPTCEPAILPEDLERVTGWMSGRLVQSHLGVLAPLVSQVSVEEQRARLQLTDTEQRIYHRILERPGLSRRDLQRSLSGVGADDRNAALTELFMRHLVRVDARGRLFGA